MMWSHLTILSGYIWLVVIIHMSLLSHVRAGLHDHFYQEAFRSSPTPTIILDHNLRIIDISDTYVAVLSITKAECLQRNFVDLTRERIGVDDAENLIEAVKAALSQRSSQYIELRDVRRHHFWHVHVKPWTNNPNGDSKVKDMLHSLRKKTTSRQSSQIPSVRFITIQATDVTHLISRSSRMEINAVSADIYHQIVDTIQEYAIFMLDTDGLVRTWNKGAQRLFQYNANEIVGSFFGLLFRSEDTQEGEPQKELLGALSENINQVEGWRVRKDGSIFHCSIAIRALYHEDGRHLGYVKVTRDLTHRKKAETALLDAYESAADLKQTFLSTASHELRSPLTSVLAGIELLLQLDPTEEQKETMQGIRHSGETLVRIVNDLLDYSKLEARAVKLVKSNIVIRDMIRQLADQYRRRSKVPIFSRVAQDVPSLIVGDSLRLQQVISNLLDNAIKFTQNGHIKVSVHLRRKSSITPNGLPKCSLLVRVEDTGIGLTPLQIERLFIPFSQADETISQHYGGTGLGLSICKQTVELMNGRIWVESTPNKGSTFIFTMDLELGVPEDVSVKTEEDGPEHVISRLNMTQAQLLPTTSINVLIVDDNESIRKVVERILYRAGLRSTTFVDGRDALEYFTELSKHLPYAHDHIVLMDIEMKHMNGLDATRAIHALPGMGNVPVIGLTANTMRSDQNKCFEAGMTGYISKPFKTDQLLSRINEEQIRLARLQTSS